MGELVNPSERIFEILNDKGISQKELSKRTGIPTSTICDWKRKGNIPTADKIILVCKALQVPPEDILGHVDNKKSNQRVIHEGDPLWEIVSAYDSMEKNQQTRVLKYMMALVNEVSS